MQAVNDAPSGNCQTLCRIGKGECSANSQCDLVGHLRQVAAWHRPSRVCRAGRGRRRCSLRRRAAGARWPRPRARSAVCSVDARRPSGRPTWARPFRAGLPPRAGQAAGGVPRLRVHCLPRRHLCVRPAGTRVGCNASVARSGARDVRPRVWWSSLAAAATPHGAPRRSATHVYYSTRKTV